MITQNLPKNKIYLMFIFVLGVPLYFLSIGGFYFFAKQWNTYRLGALMEKEAIYKHYISLHPEDFPPFGNIYYFLIFIIIIGHY